MQRPILNSSTPLKDERHFWQFNHPGKLGGRLKPVCGGSRADGTLSSHSHCGLPSYWTVRRGLDGLSVSRSERSE